MVSCDDDADCMNKEDGELDAIATQAAKGQTLRDSGH